jgi:streptogramin lyase
MVLGSILASLGFLAGSAGAQVITEFHVGITAAAEPYGITAGPDGNLWFTEWFGNRIGRIAPDGVVTEFSAGITANSAPENITAGPDGNLWFTEGFGGRVGRITPGGVVTEFNASAGVITAGPDGNLWYTGNGAVVGRITPSGVVTEFTAGILTGARIGGITAGPDGNLWFTEFAAHFRCAECPPPPPPISRIGRITPEGVVTEFTLSANAGPGSITAGPDGNLWFTASFGIGRITPDGIVTEFSAGISGGVTSIAAGPDGNLWFTEPYIDRIGRITPDGVATEFGGFKRSRDNNVGGYPVTITAGPDGNVWFTEFGDLASPGLGNRIGRITAGPPSPTTVVSSVNPSQRGHAVVFTASVAGNFPTGTVQFMDGDTPLGSPVTLSGGGIAQFMISTLTRGTHEITAVYSGDGNNAPSASAVLFQQVGGRVRHRGG